MARNSLRGHSKESVSKPKVPRAAIAGALLVVGVVAALLVFGNRRSEPASRYEVANNNKAARPLDGRARQVTHEVVNSYPHDPTSFTQGLLWHEGGFYESTGQYGQSKLRNVEFPTGKVLKELNLSPELFGEGLALVGNRLIQLTWKSKRGFVYDLSSFRLIEEFRYETEGWGLAFDGKNLILSDGSSDLFLLDPQTFKPAGKIPVRMNGRPVTELNELEFIDGEIWANVWQTDLIVRINPSTGSVTSFLDLRGINKATEQAGSDAVLNGIAYDAGQKRIFITGKLWPRIFEIKIKP